MYLFFICMVAYCLCFLFFFKQKTAYEMRISDWSSDVCSSDLRCEMARAGDGLPPSREHMVFSREDGLAFAAAPSRPDARQPVHHRGQRERILALHRAVPRVGHHIGRGFRPNPAQRRDEPRRLRQRTHLVETAMDDMDGDAGEDPDIVEEMPSGKEQRVGEIMRLDLREAEREIRSEEHTSELQSL